MPEATLRISSHLELPLEEVELRAVRAQGPGGQKVNKTASAVHLFFDIDASSLPAAIKGRLKRQRDHRITEEGVVVIKSQESRSQEGNREAAFERLRQLIQSVANPPKKRKPTRPSKAAKERRLRSKARRSLVKSNRGRPGLAD